MSHQKERFSECDDDGFPPLAHVAASIHPDQTILACMTRVLLANGAPVDETDLIGQTPLFWAVLSGNEPVTKVLLDCGASPYQASNGTSATYVRAHGDLFANFAQQPLACRLGKASRVGLGSV